MKNLVNKIFGNHSQRELKKIETIVQKIESYDEQIQQLTDEQLKNKTEEFKTRFEQGESLDSILPEAYAVCREAAWRVLKMKHYRVQLMGGIILHNGRIAEMRTGEGKTLVATLPSYLNALTGKGVHIVTVNDYLAARDAEEMGQVHNFLGLKVGCIVSNMDNSKRREAYNCDITYGTNNEFGFDYLRDNMVLYAEEMVQRDLNYAIIDEVDSILIDEARTPLIISGSGTKSTHLYKAADIFVRRLKKGQLLGEENAMSTLMREEIEEEGDFIVDEKQRSVTLTADGVKKAEQYFGIENLADPENMEIQHHITIALKAHNLMHLEKDYIVDEKGEIVIVDEFTGRLMDGRRYSDGLHQAIEAKEGVEVKKESRTLATITYQNYFNRYAKKAGMTGTGQTEETELRDIYGMDVIVIPTNMPVIRNDNPDIVFKTEAAKFNAVIEDIKNSYEKKQPVLVGTVTIDTSEHLSKLLKKEGIKHKVLNAKYHAQEAEIVSMAGKKGAITIATNMAGRGTDIKLEEGVQELGGLKIIGTERHESRRIDNQLRGRSGRQGDPGESRFYLALEDNLMRLFTPEATLKMFDTLGLPDDEPIEHKILSKAIQRAQSRVENNHYGARKHVLEYDRVMNEQREVMYAERYKVLKNENLRDNVLIMTKNVINRVVDNAISGTENPRDWDLPMMFEHLNTIIPFGEIEIKEDEIQNLNSDKFKEMLYEKALKLYEEKEAELGEQIREIERVIMLKVIDQKWMDHLDNMDQMRQGINLQSYGQRNPLVEYKFLSYDMFEEMTENIQQETVKGIFHVRIANKDMKREAVVKQTTTNHQDTSLGNKPQVKGPTIGRNDPCPCGSGKKYKNCCGQS
ncbi:preprotein translocase subunit SecA [Candidatus Epulonipiscium fishelsonii]|uniref:Preprotein translocase subunit SecA n=1 Tax=Candidatus Epulonipiscium fishelsonii TaxID=77094 RepID=A0ACC8XD33_9FIRM|nr:preprotein translocase subunit SecA [Epulopiscium sp. SCG-B11WGA-EpuloA1]ONI41853.1 preprotein translocase subunit SecA [Epulopiscium sp. SCG-B05WGA-EpuloA1]